VLGRTGLGCGTHAIGGTDGLGGIVKAELLVWGALGVDAGAVKAVLVLFGTILFILYGRAGLVADLVDLSIAINLTGFAHPRQTGTILAVVLCGARCNQAGHTIVRAYGSGGIVNTPRRFGSTVLVNALSLIANLFILTTVRGVDDFLAHGIAGQQQVTFAEEFSRWAELVMALTIFTVLVISAGLSDHFGTSIGVALHHIKAGAVRFSGRAHIVEAVGFKTVLVIRAVRLPQALNTDACILVTDEVMNLAVKVGFAGVLFVAIMVGTAGLSIRAVFITDADHALAYVFSAEQLPGAVLCGTTRSGFADTFI